MAKLRQRNVKSISEKKNDSSPVKKRETNDIGKEKVNKSMELFVLLEPMSKMKSIPEKKKECSPANKKASSSIKSIGKEKNNESMECFVLLESMSHQLKDKHTTLYKSSKRVNEALENEPKRRKTEDAVSESVRKSSRKNQMASMLKIREWTKSTRTKKKSIDEESLSQESVISLKENSPQKNATRKSVRAKRMSNDELISLSEDSVISVNENTPQKTENLTQYSTRKRKTSNVSVSSSQGFSVENEKKVDKSVETSKNYQKNAQTDKNSKIFSTEKTKKSPQKKEKVSKLNSLGKTFESQKQENSSKTAEKVKSVPKPSNKSVDLLKTTEKPKRIRQFKIQEEVVDLITPIKKTLQISVENASKTPIYRTNVEKNNIETTTDDIYDFLSLSQDSNHGGGKKTKKKPKILKVAKKPKMKPTRTKMWDLDNTQMKKVLKAIPMPKIRPKTMTLMKKPAIVISDSSLPEKKQVESDQRTPSGKKHVESYPRSPEMVDHHDDDDYFDVSPMDSPEKLSPATNKLVEDWQQSAVQVSPIHLPIPDMQSPTSPPLIAARPKKSLKPVHRITSTPIVASPWRVQDETVCPRTFYFSRASDLCPSYDSDMVNKSPEQENQDKLKTIQRSAEILRSQIMEKQRLLQQLEQSKARLQNNSTLNDSNMENMVPKNAPRPSLNPNTGKNRSPLKPLAVNVAHYASPINSPLVTKTFSPVKRVQMSIVEIKDDSNDTLFGFDDSEYVEDSNLSVTIDRTTLKEKLKNVKKLAPLKRPSMAATRPIRYDTNIINNIFKSPLKQQPRISELIYGGSTSTPNVQAMKKTKKVVETLENTDISAILNEKETSKKPNLFDDLENIEEEQAIFKAKEKPRRSYTRQPRRKRRPNNNRPHYLLGIGLSEDEYESEEEEEEIDDAEKKKRKVATKKRKEKNVEQTAEFKDFVREKNKEFEEVDKYKLVIV